MIKLKTILSAYAKLLAESNLTSYSFDRKIKAAIETIFDVDHVKIKESRPLSPPSFAHSYLSSKIHFIYKNVSLRMIVHFYHLKYPESELKGLSSQEWNDMLKTADGFPRLDTPEEILKSNNPQVKLTASITYYPHEDTGEIMSFNDFSDYHIGSVKSNNIRDLIVNAKKLIDDLGDGGDDNGPDKPEPVSPTSGKLVTV
jgi:hypothetical protein